MNKKIVFFLVLTFTILLRIAEAQGVVDVNTLTGASNINIPIYTINNGQVSVPISLTYSGSGIKSKDVEGTAGMGWNLNAGGQISRVVRGLPDDSYKDNAGTSLIGWMNSSTTANNINNFTIANNGSICLNETTDISYINRYFPYTTDTEPDLFYINAPGLSCQMVFDWSTSRFRPVNYKDLVITYNLVGGTGNNANNIASFIITDDKGTKYLFSNPEYVTQTTTLGTGTANYFPNTYKQYQHGITYADNWYLTSITDVNGNGIVFGYSAMPVRNSTDPVILYLNGSTTNALQYNILQSVTAQVVSTIGINSVNNPSSSPLFNLTWNGIYNNSGFSGQSVISTMIGMNRSFQFNYSNTNSSGSTFSRYFLRNFTEMGDCNTNLNYQFGYFGETMVSNGYSTTLPDSSSKQIDYWGYYSSTANNTSLIPSLYVSPSPSVASYPHYLIKESAAPGSDYTYTLSGNNRAADPANVMTGSLNSITYAQGGTSAITYESNDYFDAPSNTLVQGGGIRVKQIVDNDNITNTSSTRNYTYQIPGSTMSSGKPLSLPQFAFTIPYSGSATGSALWTACAALSAYDLSHEDHTIMYTSVKISQTGAGSTVYNYSVPATCWDVAAAPTCNGCSPEWSPTVSEMGRTNCSLNYGPIANGVYSYPFIPNTNYNFEQGLPLSIINYNDAGVKVAETDYAYQRSFTPSVVTAFKSDDNGLSSLQAKGYNKYFIFINTSELTTNVTKKVFDSPTLSQFETSSINYVYNSPYHKLLTQEQVVNSDNSTSTTYINYVKDFVSAAPGSNANVNALYYLKQQNVNVPVESYKQVTRNGSTLTTQANLSLYSASSNGPIINYLPSQLLTWNQPDGGNFTPLTVTSTSLTHDPGYFTVKNFDTYDNTGYLLTFDDNNQNYATTIFDHLSNQPTAIFSNARYNQVAFTDFDSQLASPVSTFSITGSGSYTPIGSHAGNAAGLATTQTLTSGTISKNTFAKNYIFSIWINSSTTGSLTLNITGLSPSPVVNYNLVGWNYYEIKIPAANLPPSFTASITSNQAVSIDDVLLYPDVAEAATATYDLVQHNKIAETNTNGISVYYQNDPQGRMLYKYDQDKNIIQRNTYVVKQNQNIGFTPVIARSSPVYSNVPMTAYITGITSCNVGGITVTWTFGDNSSAVQTVLSVSPSHTYTSIGSYTVTAVVTSPLFGTKTVTSVVNVIAQPMVSLSYTHSNPAAGSISSVTFTPISPGGTSYTFTGSQLATAKVLLGSYNIAITLTGVVPPAKFASNWAIYLKGDCTTQNQQYTTSGTYNFSVSLSNCTTLSLTLTGYVGP